MPSGLRGAQHVPASSDCSHLQRRDFPPIYFEKQHEFNTCCCSAYLHIVPYTTPTFSATAVSAASVSTSNRAAGIGKRAACPRCAAKDVLLPLQLPMDETRSASFAVDAARAVRAASKLGTAVRNFLDGHGSPRLLYGPSVIHFFQIKKIFVICLRTIFPAPACTSAGMGKRLISTNRARLSGCLTALDSVSFLYVRSESMGP